MASCCDVGGVAPSIRGVACSIARDACISLWSENCISKERMVLVVCRAEARADVVRDADGVVLRRRRRRALDRDRVPRHQPEDRHEHHPISTKSACFFSRFSAPWLGASRFFTR
eukprot:3706629-Prymnesium_polylepis.1